MLSTTVDTEEYDYIICGGGTAGCVLAGRLAEDPSLRILILEAGPDNADLENVHMAGGWANLLDSEETDWNILTEPTPGINGRQVKCSRGRLLGGSSGLNGTLCIRGPKQDYDDWGLEGWSGEEMYRYMKKAETFHPKDWFEASDSYHGTSGPLHTAPHDLAPISQRILQSYASKGLPYNPDMFTTGETAIGCGHAVRTVHEGLRSTAADFVTKTYRREHCVIMTEVVVDRVVLEKDGGELVAKGVVAVTKDGTKEFRAKREVIVSAGAYCSPPILMRSGIGGKEELESKGIECLVDLPGVGKNLQDHVVIFMFYKVTRPNLTNDHLVYTPDGPMTAYMLYKEKKAGILSTFPFGAFAYTRLDDRLQDSEIWNSAPRKPGRDPMHLTPSQPNVEFANIELYGGPKQFNTFPKPGESALGIGIVLMNTQSRGYVALNAENPKDPLAKFVVDHAYLSNELDAEVLAEGCRMADEIVREGEGTRDIVAGAWGEPGDHGGDFDKCKTREDWKTWLRARATTCYHAGGTCAMGPDDSPTAVLDARLQVRGVRNLRVVDVSSAPLINNGHTQMVAYGIGEGAAEMIMADAGLKGKSS